MELGKLPELKEKGRRGGGGRLLTSAELSLGKVKHWSVQGRPLGWRKSPRVGSPKAQGEGLFVSVPVMP